MRAARLLRILLLLQNRGRMTSAALAAELEVVPRTILRDVEAMTEAGLPVLVHRGAGGGIELGYNPRARLTGLDAAEAEALALLLARPQPELAALGMEAAAARAAAKLVESLPERVRGAIAASRARFRFAEAPHAAPDPRVAALAVAVREARPVRLAVRSAAPRAVRPAALIAGPDGWSLVDADDPDTPIPLAEWGDISIGGAPPRSGR